MPWTNGRRSSRATIHSASAVWVAGRSHLRKLHSEDRFTSSKLATPISVVQNGRRKPAATGAAMCRTANFKNQPQKRTKPNAMKKILPRRLTALLLLAAAASAYAEPDAITITILATFDVGTGNSTTAYHINNRGDISGYYTDAAITFYRGFIRLANGTIISPIIEPNDNGNYTALFGINDARTITGEFNQDGTYHGFFLSHNVYTQYDVGFPNVSTGVFGINNVGDFVGSFGSFTQPDQGFINVSGNLTTFTVPGSYNTEPADINQTDQIIGYYGDQAMVNHGFFRDTNGTFTYPIEPNGATYSLLLGINDSGIMVGRYADANGVHAMIVKGLNRFVSYDYPGATETSFNGINRHNMISGRYTDAGGLRHGFLAQVSTH
jgi:hypothetical protein